MSAPRKTEAEARAAVAQMVPIMAIEGRQMSDRDKDLLVDLIRGVITIDDFAAIITREAGYELD
ncbi:antitoxin VbhA family protein [Rhodococcus indonesiensis]